MTDNPELLYVRRPTPSEIRQGYGATHYREFSVSEACDAQRAPRAWLLADDGWRYYR